MPDPIMTDDRVKKLARSFAAQVEGATPPALQALLETLKQENLILLRECVRPLDCGDHYCRYCRAKSPLWEHSEHCPYADSVRKVENARLILDDLAATLRGGDA